MAIVANLARPAATTSRDTSVKYAQSLLDPHICTMNTGGDTLITGTFPATDDRGNPNTTIDWTKAGSDTVKP